jgi:hypothetical protein
VALTGDRIEAKFTLNGAPIGAVIPAARQREIAIDIVGGGAIDCVDILKNGELLKRFSQTDVDDDGGAADVIHTKLYLELGWGAKHREAEWQVEFGIDEGTLLSVEPRFRGLEVVSPAERNAADGESFYRSRVLSRGESSVRFETVSRGNPTNSTSATQGVCLEVEMPPSATVWAVINGVRVEHSLAELIAGARSGSLDHTDAPSWRFHRAPLPHQWQWKLDYSDCDDDANEGSYYVRVRQTNDQWAWASPVFLRS